MKISHVISSIDNASGGPSRSVTHSIQAMLEQDDTLQVDLNTCKSENPIINNFVSVNGNINFHEYNFLKFSKSLRQALHNSNTDIFHGNGLWQYPVHSMVKTALNRNIPYVISVHGMLEPWALQQGKLKKQIALKLFQYNDLAKASCIHATAPMEVESIRKLGFKNPIAMIPNGVQIEEFPIIVPNKTKTPKKILFLSRIVKNKGVEEIIEAWSMLDQELKRHWKIEIVGNGKEFYINKLKHIIKLKDLQDQIVLIGPIFGDDKMIKFHEADLFVLPTYSENFGIVVAEALASYTPVITTKGAPWGDLELSNCGWWIDIGVEPLKQALEVAMQTKETELIRMGKNGRKLIEDKYSMESVAKQMCELYEWLLTKKNKPDFIR
jgi:glycosyltransferase involved in cell wall biosynthesis